MPDPIQIPVIGGVNRHAHIRRIPDGEVYSTKNLIGGKGILPQTRRGADYVQKMTPGTYLTDVGDTPHAFWSPRLETSGYYFGSHWGETYGNWIFQRYDSAGAVTHSFMQQATGYYDRKPQMFEMGNKAYFVTPTGVGNGGGDRYPMIEVDYGVAVAPTAITWSDAQTTVPYPRIACNYRNRAVYGRLFAVNGGGAFSSTLASGYENLIIFSDRDDPQAIGEDALDVRALPVGTQSDGQMVALVEVMQNAVGSPAQSALLVLYEYAAYLVTGEPNYSTSTDQDPEAIFGSLVVSRFNMDCGCAAAETIAHTPYGLVWAGHDQVWLMAEGSVPRPVGLKVRSRLMDNDPKFRPSWHAAYHEGYYRLAIAASGQTPPNPVFSLGTTSESPVVALNEQWWLDLTDGPPGNEDVARWWGPQMYAQPTTHMLVEVKTGSKPRLLGLGADGAATNGAIILDLHPSSDPEVDDTNSTGSNTDITTQIVTKEYEFGDPSTEKTFLAAEAVVSSSVPADVAVTVGAEEAIAQPSAPDVFEALGFSVLNTRVTAKTLQFQLTTESGHTELAEWIAWVDVIPRRPVIV